MKHTKKFLTVLMIAMMLCTLFATNAFAVAVAQPQGFDITKNLTVPEGAAVPKETFNFTVTPKEDVTEGYNEELKVNVYKGVNLGNEADQTIASEALQKQGTEKGNDTFSAKTFVGLTQTTFDKTGVYVYTVKETAGTTPGMTYSKKEYTVYVYVGKDKNIIAVKAYDNENTAEKKPIVFDNAFTTKSLTVTKTVEGNMGDTEKKFDFTLDVTGCDQLPEGSAIAATINRSNGSTENDTVTVGTQFTFQLAHGDSLVVSNLPINVAYKVAESDYSGEGYTTTMNDETTLEKESTMRDVDTVAVVNTNGTTIDTGVMIDFAPYVLIFIVAVGAAVMFIRKRKTSTEE